MAIPPQLAEVLSVQASAVQEFCNMASGIPWTNQMLDDMLETMAIKSCWQVYSDMSPPMNGIVVNFDIKEEKIGKTVKKFIVPEIGCWGGGSGAQTPAIYHGDGLFTKRFAFDRQGLKQAIEFAQEKTQNMKRRGLCETCLTSERPAKRLRVGNTGLCTKCLLHKAVF